MGNSCCHSEPRPKTSDFQTVTKIAKKRTFASIIRLTSRHDDEDSDVEDVNGFQTTLTEAEAQRQKLNGEIVTTQQRLTIIHAEIPTHASLIRTAEMKEKRLKKREENMRKEQELIAARRSERRKLRKKAKQQQHHDEQISPVSKTTEEDPNNYSADSLGDIAGADGMPKRKFDEHGRMLLMSSIFSDVTPTTSEGNHENSGCGVIPNNSNMMPASSAQQQIRTSSPVAISAATSNIHNMTNSSNFVSQENIFSIDNVNNNINNIFPISSRPATGMKRSGFSPVSADESSSDGDQSETIVLEGTINGHNQKGMTTEKNGEKEKFETSKFDDRDESDCLNDSRPGSARRLHPRGINQRNSSKENVRSDDEGDDVDVNEDENNDDDDDFDEEDEAEKEDEDLSAENLKLLADNQAALNSIGKGYMHPILQKLQQIKEKFEARKKKQMEKENLAQPGQWSVAKARERNVFLTNLMKKRQLVDFQKVANQLILQQKQQRRQNKTEEDGQSAETATAANLTNSESTRRSESGLTPNAEEKIQAEHDEFFKSVGRLEKSLINSKKATSAETTNFTNSKSSSWGPTSGEHILSLLRKLKSGQNVESGENTPSRSVSPVSSESVASPMKKNKKIPMQIHDPDLLLFQSRQRKTKIYLEGLIKNVISQERALRKRMEVREQMHLTSIVLVQSFGENHENILREMRRIKIQQRKSHLSLASRAGATTTATAAPSPTNNPTREGGENRKQIEFISENNLLLYPRMMAAERSEREKSASSPIRRDNVDSPPNISNAINNSTTAPPSLRDDGSEDGDESASEDNEENIFVVSGSLPDVDQIRNNNIIPRHKKKRQIAGRKNSEQVLPLSIANMEKAFGPSPLTQSLQAPSLASTSPNVKQQRNQLILDTNTNHAQSGRESRMTNSLPVLASRQISGINDQDDVSYSCNNNNNNRTRNNGHIINKMNSGLTNHSSFYGECFQDDDDGGNEPETPQTKMTNVLAAATLKHSGGTSFCQSHHSSLLRAATTKLILVKRVVTSASSPSHDHNADHQQNNRNNNSGSVLQQFANSNPNNEVSSTNVLVNLNKISALANPHRDKSNQVSSNFVNLDQVADVNNRIVVVGAGGSRNFGKNRKSSKGSFLSVASATPLPRDNSSEFVVVGGGDGDGTAVTTRPFSVASSSHFGRNSVSSANDNVINAIRSRSSLGNTKRMSQQQIEQEEKEKAISNWEYDHKPMDTSQMLCPNGQPIPQTPLVAVGNNNNNNNNNSSLKKSASRPNSAFVASSFFVSSNTAGDGGNEHQQQQRKSVSTTPPPKMDEEDLKNYENLKRLEQSSSTFQQHSRLEQLHSRLLMSSPNSSSPSRPTSAVVVRSQPQESARKNVTVVVGTKAPNHALFSVPSTPAVAKAAQDKIATFSTNKNHINKNSIHRQRQQEEENQSEAVSSSNKKINRNPLQFFAQFEDADLITNDENQDENENDDQIDSHFRKSSPHKIPMPSPPTIGFTHTNVFHSASKFQQQQNLKRMQQQYDAQRKQAMTSQTASQQRRPNTARIGNNNNSYSHHTPLLPIFMKTESVGKNLFGETTSPHNNHTTKNISSPPEIVPQQNAQSKNTFITLTLPSPKNNSNSNKVVSVSANLASRNQELEDKEYAEMINRNEEKEEESASDTHEFIGSEGRGDGNSSIRTNDNSTDHHHHHHNHHHHHQTHTHSHHGHKNSSSMNALLTSSINLPKNSTTSPRSKTKDYYCDEDDDDNDAAGDHERSGTSTFQSFEESINRDHHHHHQHAKHRKQHETLLNDLHYREK